ncbi:MAG: hypothetical protein WD673_08640 [Alphaproteobacteria bacterium]
MTATAATTIGVELRRPSGAGARRWRLVVLDMVAAFTLMGFVAAPVFAVVGVAGVILGEPACQARASVDDLRHDFSAVLRATPRP